MVTELLPVWLIESLVVSGSVCMTHWSSEEEPDCVSE